MRSKSKPPKNVVMKAMYDLFDHMNNNVTILNNSKLFAGLMIIILNISSKFVEMKLSKTMEAYLKYTFSRDILVFAIAWMGTREIYIAIVITILFKVVFDYLFNENSKWCCLPPNFTQYHISLLENNQKVTETDIKKANEVLEKAKKQKEEETAAVAASSSVPKDKTSSASPSPPNVSPYQNYFYM